jgi:long-chain acyl-CoA synthetase
VERFAKVASAQLVERCGLIETSPVVCFRSLNCTPKAGSIGIPAPNTDVRLVDDQGLQVAMGPPGELNLRIPPVTHGHWQRPDVAAEAMKDGWLYTGDVAVTDAIGIFKSVD